MAIAPSPNHRDDLPDHRDLPDSDGNFAQSFMEHPQSLMLTLSLLPHLRRRFPDGQYCIGQDSGIYWKITDPPERGVKAPDWFLVVGVPPNLDGDFRRSYVLWQELNVPQIVLEFASGDGSEERDPTPMSGKFWVYERGIRVPLYGIYLLHPARIEMFQLVGDSYRPMIANERGRYPLPRIGVELGLWPGEFLGEDVPWMRWWDEAGNLLLMGNERADEEHHRAETERQRAEMERQRADVERQRAEDEGRRADEESLRAEAECRRADEECQRAYEERRRAERLAARLRELGLDPDEI